MLTESLTTLLFLGKEKAQRISPGGLNESSLSDSVSFLLAIELPMSDLEHEQAPILENGEVVFHVDIKLQSLMQFFWDNDIVTFNSCQDNVGGMCWIQFDVTDWMRLSDISFKSAEQAFYRFIEEHCEVLLLSSGDGQIDENDEFWIEGEELIWSASVRFPKGMISTFEEVVVTTRK